MWKVYRPIEARLMISRQDLVVGSALCRHWKELNVGARKREHTLTAVGSKAILARNVGG